MQRESDRFKVTFTIDVRLCRLKTVPELKEYNINNGRAVHKCDIIRRTNNNVLYYIYCQ